MRGAGLAWPRTVQSSRKLRTRVGTFSSAFPIGRLFHPPPSLTCRSGRAERSFPRLPCSLSFRSCPGLLRVLSCSKPSRRTRFAQRELLPRCLCLVFCQFLFVRHHTTKWTSQRERERRPRFPSSCEAAATKSPPIEFFPLVATIRGAVRSPPY